MIRDNRKLDSGTTRSSVRSRSFGTLQEFGSRYRFTIEIFTRGNRNAAQAGMEPLHLFRRALASPAMFRFIPALSVHETSERDAGIRPSVGFLDSRRIASRCAHLLLGYLRPPPLSPAFSFLAPLCSLLVTSPRNPSSIDSPHGTVEARFPDRNAAPTGEG